MKLAFGTMLFFLAGMAQAEDRTIWLQPGNCIVVGNQQVCAAKSGDSSTTEKPVNTHTHVCKNGIQDEADANLKGWAHVVITTGPDGKKISQETMKTFGPLGKKECQGDIAGKN